MYIAKPYDQNFVDAKQFKSLAEAKNYLDAYIKPKKKSRENLPHYKMSVADWCLLGKIATIDSEGKINPIEVDMSRFV